MSICTRCNKQVVEVLVCTTCEKQIATKAAEEMRERCEEIAADEEMGHDNLNEPERAATAENIKDKIRALSGRPEPNPDKGTDQ